jgi:hypothetical protein
VSRRRAPAEPATAHLALRSLLAGLSDDEIAAGLFTAVPACTELLGVDVADGIATVDLSSEFEEAGGSLAETLRLAQVVYTLTQFETIDGVSFRLECEPVELFGGHGVPLAREGRLLLAHVAKAHGLDCARLNECTLLHRADRGELSVQVGHPGKEALGEVAIKFHAHCRVSV